MTDTKYQEITDLLTEGKTAREIIAQGYKAGTVYSTQRKWKQGKGKGATEVESPLSNHTPESGSVIEIETDPEIIQLKKEIRIAELQKVITDAPPPWLAKVMGHDEESRIRFERSEMEESVAEA